MACAGGCGPGCCGSDEGEVYSSGSLSNGIAPLSGIRNQASISITRASGAVTPLSLFGRVMTPDVAAAALSTGPHYADSSRESPEPLQERLESPGHRRRPLSPVFGAGYERGKHCQDFGIHELYIYVSKYTEGRSLDNVVKPYGEFAQQMAEIKCRTRASGDCFAGNQCWPPLHMSGWEYHIESIGGEGREGEEEATAIDPDDSNPAPENRMHIIVHGYDDCYGFCRKG